MVGDDEVESEAAKPMDSRLMSQRYDADIGKQEEEQSGRDQLS